MRRGLLVTAGAVTLMLATAATAATAWAGTVSVTDPVGDTGSRSDIRRVTVEHVHTADRLRIITGLSRIVIGVELDVYLDTRRAHPGPEWKVAALPDSEWALLRVRDWRDAGTVGPVCGRVRYSTSSVHPVARVSLPSSCLDLHRDVKVSVLAVDPGHGRDWAPARRTFLPAA